VYRDEADDDRHEVAGRAANAAATSWRSAFSDVTTSAPQHRKRPPAPWGRARRELEVVGLARRSLWLTPGRTIAIVVRITLESGVSLWGERKR
jgi:hypothetical protein